MGSQNEVLSCLALEARLDLNFGRPSWLRFLSARSISGLCHLAWLFVLLDEIMYFALVVWMSSWVLSSLSCCFVLIETRFLCVAQAVLEVDQ